jgi:hypothetical protein
MRLEDPLFEVGSRHEFQGEIRTIFRAGDAAPILAI